MRAGGGSGHGAVLTEDTSWLSRRGTRAGAALCVAGLATAQIVAVVRGLHSPFGGLADDIAGHGMLGLTAWAALGLAMVGLSTRARIVTAAGTLAVTAVLALVLVTQVPFATLGPRLTGPPLIALAILTAIAFLRWDGRQRDNALRGISLAALLIAGRKIGDMWFIATVQAAPRVLDQFTVRADQALGQPAWVMGAALDALGPVPQTILVVIYDGLPIGAMGVALWQLRRVRTHGWPVHNLVRTFLVLGLTGPLVYLIFPVVGPYFAFSPGGAGWQLANAWPHTVPTLTAAPVPFAFDGTTARNCMPSMHTAWALALFIHSRRGPRWLRWGGTGWLIGTLCATLGFGFHYGVDLVAGAVLCLTVESALRNPALGWNRYRFRLVGMGVVALLCLVLSFRFLSPVLAAVPLLSGSLILTVLGAAILVFYSCWFAAPGTPLGRWGARLLGQSPQPAAEPALADR